VVILVSDGESTCGDPCPVAQQLAASARHLPDGSAAPDRDDVARTYATPLG